MTRKRELESILTVSLSNPVTMEDPMKYSFYDVKTRKKVQAEVTGFPTYGKGKQKRYAFTAETKDGRKLLTFVKKEEYEAAKKK